MTPTQMTLVRATFGAVVPIADQAAALFYGRLFELDPSLQSLFGTDIKEQGRKLMQVLAYCVAKLDAPDELLPAVRALGARHAHYGVEPKDYDTVASALLWTLEKGLGAAFTDPVKDAWASVYQVLARTMQEVPPQS
jgi:hemoglobin-like flavoprotein